MSGLLDGVTYDTRLSPAEERAFAAWRARLPANLRSTADYDLRAAWKANAQEAANGHLPDPYKKPNHMTFSDESIYASPEHPGGHWSGDDKAGWSYAAPRGLSGHTADDLLNYFQAFEAGKDVDPVTGRISYGRPSRVVLPRGTR